MRPASRLGAGLLLVLVGGCTALFGGGLDDPQCSIDADCAREPALAGRVCRDRFCVTPAITATNPPATPCISAEQCTSDAGGEASICRSGSCVRILSPECRWVSGDFADPNAILLGAILPERVKQVNGVLVDYPYAHRVRLAEDLAARQWTAQKGIPASGSSLRRPLALVQCDDAHDPAFTREALRHLLDVVRVPSLLAFDDDELATLEPTIVERKPAIVCTDCLGPSSNALAQSGLVRRVLPPLEQQAALAVEMVKLLEQRVRTERALAPRDRVRVALVSIDDAAGRSYAEAVRTRLVLNGDPPGQQGASFLRIDHPSPTKGSIDALGDIGDPIAKFRPHIVLVSTGSDFARRFGPAIEARWPAGEARPYYVPNEMALELGPFAAWVASDDVLRKRILGVAPLVDGVGERNMAAFRSQWDAVFGTEGPSDESYSGFDGFHALAYAVTAAIQLPELRGADIARSFDRLLAPGLAVDIGETGLALGPPLLLAGGNVDLHGLWNALDWKLPSGELMTNGTVWCLGRSPQGDLTLVHDGGLHYLAQSGTTSGAIACP